MAPRRALSAVTVSAIAASAVMVVLSAATAPAAAAPIMARDGAAITAAAPVVDLEVVAGDEEPKKPATDDEADAVVALVDAVKDDDDAGADGKTAKGDAAGTLSLGTTALVGPAGEEFDAIEPVGQTDGEEDLEKGAVVRTSDKEAADKAANGDTQTDEGDDLTADTPHEAMDDEEEVVVAKMEPAPAPDVDEADAEDKSDVKLVDVLIDAEDESAVVEGSA